MSQNCHSIVILVSPYQIFLSSRRHQTVSLGEKETKVVMSTFQTPKDGQESSERHNFIVEMFHRHVYHQKFQKLSS